jgi:hypothetical protein
MYSLSSIMFMRIHIRAEILRVYMEKERKMRKKGGGEFEGFFNMKCVFKLGSLEARSAC